MDSLGPFAGYCDIEDLYSRNHNIIFVKSPENLTSNEAIERYLDSRSSNIKGGNIGGNINNACRKSNNGGRKSNNGGRKSNIGGILTKTHKFIHIRGFLSKNK